ncbi:MAG: NYN domain-containing protein [Nitrospiraceae bacterium]
MHLIIDGYNLMGVKGLSSSMSGGSLESGREQMLRELAAYRQRKGHPITVVFDGWRQGGATESREHRSGIEVIYSKRGERADQVVQRLAVEYGRECAVVSSDQEVVRFAKACGAFVIGAREFDARLHRPSTNAPTGRVRPKEREDRDDQEPRSSAEKKGNPRKLPKALRKRNRQLKGF